MHALSKAAALDHMGRLTEFHSSHELLALATEQLPAAIIPEALYVRADGRLLLLLARGDEYDAASQADDVVVFDPQTRATRFERLLRGAWPGALLWSREPRMA
jgi:hypothetical protein